MKEDFFYNGDDKIPLKKIKPPDDTSSLNDNNSLQKKITFKTKPDKSTEKKEKGLEGAGDNDNAEIIDCNSGEKMILTDEFYLRFKNNINSEELDKFIYDNNLTMLRKFEYDDNLYLFQFRDNKDALDKINAFKNNPLVEFSNPNFTRIIKKMFVPGDNPKFVNQWALNQSSAFDIKTLQAWNETRGSDSITIAIIDEGVDYQHEDLNVNGKLVRGFDYIYPPALDPSPVGNNTHGTNCAGVAAAALNNIGIVGVAPGCKIMGMRVATGKVWKIPDLIAHSIDAFTDAMKNENKVDVISCSWGLSHIPTELSNIIIKAATEGRDGKGIVVCMAAGNYYEEDYQQDDFDVLSSARLENVISVGAYGLDGKNKTITQEDIDNDTELWGSRYLPTGFVDILAPGVRIWTTDIMGNNGNPGNYIGFFNGTSAATPFVAGAAALILSVNKNLNAAQVRQILIDSSMGNGGRLDVHAALMIAKAIQ